MMVPRCVLGQAVEPVQDVGKEWEVIKEEPAVPLAPLAFEEDVERKGPRQHHT